ncbi:MAG: reverse transcriptase family protein [Planctomycetes bacterium]|nr:reverse transcriptase family protein [Planctomycetota bacterium]
MAELKKTEPKKTSKWSGCLAIALGLAVVGWCLYSIVRGVVGLFHMGPVTFGVVAGVIGLVIAWFVARSWWRKGGRNAVRRAFWIAPGVAELARRLDVTPERLRTFSPVYREVRIPKRSGGVRVLHVPDANTKSLQRKILHRLLARLKSHPAAYGFEAGRSIAHHAAQHTKRAIVLHFDVVDFFPSTRAERIERMFLRLGWNREAALVLTKLTTHKGGLPQGAPTSPRLSNLVNAGLDRALTKRVGELRGRYSRYADDISVSFPKDRRGSVERTKARVMHELCLRGYEMHVRKKLSVRRAHQRQVVTGLVVNEKVALPRHLRRKLRAARHHLATGRPATWTDEQLRGWAAFEKMVRDQGAPPPQDGDGTTPKA